MIRYEVLEGATVCLCAPTRSSAQAIDLERRLGLAGASVLAPVPPGGEVSPIERARLTGLHMRKIESADVVVVGNTGGYIGAGTTGEIAHALRLGRPVQLAEDPLDLATDPETYAALVGRTASMDVRPSEAFPAPLNRGSLVTVFAPGDGRGRCGWFRVADVLAFPGRMQAAVALDPTRVRAGLDTEGLLTRLDAAYPGEDERPFCAVELEFIAELTEAAHPVAARRPGPTVRLLARDAAGAIALTPGPTGTLELPARRLAPGQAPAEAAEQFALDLFDGHAPALRLAALDLETLGGGRPGDAQVFACDLGSLDAGAGGGLEAQSPFVLTAPLQVAAHTDPRTARIIHALARHAGADGVLVFEDGYLPGERTEWEWHEAATPPAGVPVTHSGVWAVDQDGRVVLQHRCEQRRFTLPAGSPEPEDRDWLATAAREAFEESQFLIDQRRARLIGFQVTYVHPGFPNGLAQARYVAPLIGYLPIAPDADPKLAASRGPYRRYLVDLRHAARLLDWGPHVVAQIRAAEQAALEMGLPADRPAGDDYRDHGDPHMADQAPAWELIL